MKRFIILLLTLVTMVTISVGATTIPETAPKTGIYDPSNYLDESVVKTLAEFNEFWLQNPNDHPQLGIVFIDELNNQTIEDLALNTARHWKIGHYDDNKGILLLVAVKDRKWRVEVSNNLNTVISDKIAYQLGDSMSDAFRKENYSQGVNIFIENLDHKLKQTYVTTQDNSPSVISIGYLALGGIFILIGLVVGFFENHKPSHPKVNHKLEALRRAKREETTNHTQDDLTHAVTAAHIYQRSNKSKSSSNDSHHSGSSDTWSGGGFSGGGASGGW